MSREHHIYSTAFSTAIAFLERLPKERKPASDIEDMKEELYNLLPGNASLSLYFDLAQQRVNAFIEQAKDIPPEA